MNKLILALASLVAVASVACGSSSEPEGESSEDVAVEVESSAELQATCYWRAICTTTRVRSSITSCNATCSGRCFTDAYCCNGRCSFR